MSNFKKINHGLDLGGLHSLKGAQLESVKQETITLAQYDAIPTTGGAIAGFDKRIFIVLLGAGMAFLATTNLNADGTALVKTKSGNDAQIAEIVADLANLTATVGTQGAAITSLLGRTNAIEVAATALEGRVATAEGTITSQGLSIATQAAAISTNKAAQDLLNTDLTNQIDALVLSTGAVGITGHTIAGNVISLFFKKADGSTTTEAIDISSAIVAAEIGGVLFDSNTYELVVTEGGVEKRANLATLIENYLTTVFQAKFDTALAASDVLRIDTPQTLTAPQKAAVLAKLGAASSDELAAVNDRVGSFVGFKGTDGVTDVTSAMEAIDKVFQELVEAQLLIVQLQLANRKEELTNVTLVPGPNYFSPFSDPSVAAPRISPAVRVLNAAGDEEMFTPKTEIVGGLRKLRIDNPDTVDMVGMTVSVDW